MLVQLFEKVTPPFQPEQVASLPMGPRLNIDIMRSQLLALLLLCGCSSVPAPDSPQQLALNSCFFCDDDQKGWSFLETPPSNATELKALASAQRTGGASLDDAYNQLWFRHADGRLLICSLFSLGNLPAACSNIQYEFVHGANGWIAQMGNPVICY